jgi:hypothetical protein
VGQAAPAPTAEEKELWQRIKSARASSSLVSDVAFVVSEINHVEFKRHVRMFLYTVVHLLSSHISEIWSKSTLAWGLKHFLSIQPVIINAMDHISLHGRSVRHLGIQVR